MLNLLIGHPVTSHTVCGHPDGYTIRETVIDGGYHSVGQALVDNAEILFEDEECSTHYLVIRDKLGVVQATGHWLPDEILVVGTTNAWSVRKSDKTIWEKKLG